MHVSVLRLLLAPFILSLILTGIHTYLGLHVLERGLIFVDLSLAQLAALGAAIGMLLPGGDGSAHGRPAAYWISLGCTVLGAALFAEVRSRKPRIPQEAIIGTCYIVACAGALLAISRTPSQPRHLQQMLAGDILSIPSSEVWMTAIVYGAIGVFHIWFRRVFLLISIDPRRAAADGLSIKRWDFLFYVSLGVVVTASVPMAGVLLVFCYLLVPAVAATLYAHRMGSRLAIGWAMGTVVSVIGVYLSIELRLPAGATTVCAFGLVLALMAIGRPYFHRSAAPALHVS
jgi:zinc/manganese transport system permease protein